MNLPVLRLLAALTIAAALSAQGYFPQGLAPGQSYRVIVVTDTTTSALSDNIADYDAVVANDIANSPQLSALDTTWQALVSTASVDAKVHTGTAGGGGVPIYLANGLRAFHHYGTLWSASPVRPINVTVSGATAPTLAWTGTHWNGTQSYPLGDPGGWCRLGRPNDADTRWMSVGIGPRASEHPIYGLSGVLTVPTVNHPPGLQPGDAYRILAVTDGTRDATSNDIADYDTFINDELQHNVAVNGLQPNWRAFVSIQGGVNVRTHTGTDVAGGVPIYRLDGTRVFDDYDHMWNTSSSNPPLAPPNLTLSQVTATERVWTGTNSSGQTLQGVGTWTNTVVVGDANSSGYGWLTYSVAPKTESRPIYALSDLIIVPLPAVETTRLGTPPNANALMPGQTSAPVIGQTWDPVVDHTTFAPNAALDFAMFGSAQANVPVPNLGTVLINQMFGSISAAPGQPLPLALPFDPNLLGMQFSVQGLTLDWNWQLHATNALDVVIGSE